MGKDYLSQSLDFCKWGNREKVFSQELRGCISLRLKWLKRIQNQLIMHEWPEKEVLDASMHKGKAEYYIRNGKTKKYISKSNLNLAYRMAQRDYEKLVLNAIEKEEKMWTKVLRDWRSPEDILDNVGSARRTLIKPIVEDSNKIIEEWQSQLYTGKDFEINDKTEFYTRRGERVRSKSEVLIADMLYEAEVPYLYEFPVKLGRYTAYPDFMILNKRTMEVYIWEHLGMMDNPEYVETCMRKIKDYATYGWVQGKNLLLTFEAARCPISTRLIKKIIEENLI